MSHSNVPEPSQEHFIKASTETNRNFEHDTVLPPLEDDMNGIQIFYLPIAFRWELLNILMP